MPPESQSPLERLHRRIVAQDNTLTEADVDKAVADEIAALKEKFKDDPATLSNREGRLREFHERLKAERADLYKAYREGKLDFFADSRLLWEAMPSLEALKERPRQFGEAVNEARRLTDPERDGEDAIDDYEGWGPGWISEGSNKDNETRWTLSGYMTAMGLDGPQTREAAYARANEVYGSWTGSVLKYDELREDMAMGKYLDELRKYPDLEDEPKGYLAGCLALSETSYPATNDAYRKYLYETVDKMGADGAFKISPEKNKWERGHDQMAKLTAVHSPREWNETHLEARKAFERLKNSAAVLVTALGFTLPPDVVQFLNKELLTVTNGDMKKISDYSDMIAALARGALVEKRRALGVKAGEVENKLNDLIGKNGSAKKYTEQSINDLKARFEKAKAAAGAAAGTLLMLEAAVSENAALESAASELNLVAGTIDSMLAGLVVVGGGGGGGGTGGGGGGPSEGPPTGVDEYENKWSSAEMVDGRWSVADVKVASSLADTPFRDDKGKIGGKISGGTKLRILDVKAKCRKVEGVTFVQVDYNGKSVWVDESALVLGEESIESTEARERASFIQQKDLNEVKKGEKYRYDLNIYSQTVKNNKPFQQFKNTDVERIFGKKYNENLTDPVNDKILKLYNKALKDSGMEFDGQPKIADLRKSYNEKFIPVWEKAAKDLDNIIGGKKEKKETTPEGTKQATTIDPEITKMLGGVEAAHKYADASRLILEYIKHPEKYPSGVTVQMPFNNTLVPAVVYFAQGAGGPAFISFQSAPVRRYRYSSMEALVKRMHQGHILSRRQYDILGDEGSYKQWENYIGQLDVLDQEATYGESASKWTHKLEFDWPGRDPDIWVRPDKHGRIQYLIDRNHAAPDGSDVHEGYCENFNAFLVVMKRHRDWTEKYDDIPDGQKAVEALKERKYTDIVNPLAFRAFYKQIGRVVRLLTRANGVDMILDWGGGNDINSRKNAKLNVWVTAEGQLAWSLSREDITRTGASGTSPNITGIATAVSKIKRNL